MGWIFLAKCTVVVRIFCTSEFSEPCVFIVHVQSLFGDWPHILHWTSPVWTRSGGSLNWTKLDQHVGLWGDAKLNALELLCWQGRLGTRVRSNMDGWIDVHLWVGGLTPILQVCIVQFLVFWGSGKFGLKKLLGVTFLFGASLIYKLKSDWGCPSFQ